MVKTIVLVASPRAGSTNFQRVLQSFPSVETFGEAFNPRGGMDLHRVGEVAAFKGMAGVDLTELRGRIGELWRKDPLAACYDFLRFAEAQSAEYANFKILPGHLSAPR